LYLLFCVDAKRGLSSNETTETERIWEQRHENIWT
jgi:hypothetical protein